MSKKKIDELFQDKFLDFKEAPDDRVWASIEASLDKKKKKRILPLWWSLGGIAAALLVGLLIFNPFNTESNTDQIITDIEQEQKDTKENNTIEELDLLDKDTIEVATETEETPTVIEKMETQIVNTKKTEGKPSIDTEKANRNSIPITGSDGFKKNEAVVQSPRQHKDTDGKYQDINKKDHLKSSTTVADAVDAVKQSSKDLNTLKNPNLEQTNVKVSDETAIAGNTADSKQTKEIKNGVGNAEIVNQIDTENKETQITQNKAEQKTDSITGANKKSIFDEIESQQEEAVVETSTKKWSAGPSVAPVYFNALGEGSSVHSIFVPNAKSGNVNMSYGVSVGYELSSKLRVRTGIHKVDFGYDTNDIAFSSSPIATTNGQIDNIDYRTTSKNLVVSSKPGGSALEQAPTNSLDFSASQNLERDGVMTQQMGYLEIPLELNYALIDKKFGLNVIGGVSSLFLINNSVALSSGNLTTEMGEANNLNDLNFSANFGLGVNYKFSRNIHLNIEPVFKYQLNTFSQTDGTFNPYALGVYSGLNFRF